MTTLGQRIIDADGHVFEDIAGIWRFMPESYRPANLRGRGLFPELDNVHIAAGQRPEGSFNFDVDAKAWIHFADALNLEAAVLYPTFGLAFGRIRHVGWARAVARAYNDWLADEYLAKSPRFRGMALIPLQDPDAAVAELRRAVLELGMCGAVLTPSGINGLLGDLQYRPIFEAANELSCVIAIHGGSYAGLGGLDLMNTLAGAHALGHPLTNLIQFTSLTLNGTFDDYANVRFAFLEGGAAWILFALERLDGSYRSFVPYNFDGDLLKLRDGETVRDRLLGHLRGGRIFVGVEGDEAELAHCVKTIGVQPFVFSSDFPHEVNLEICRHEIEEVLENAELNESDKAAILYGNSQRLYALESVPA